MSTNQGRDAPVIRHAADPRSYGTPAWEHQGKVGHATVIPGSRGHADGRSLGFDPNVAGPVHVDPDYPGGGGGVIFDPSSVHPSHLASAVAQAIEPHEAYYRLGTPAGQSPYPQEVQPVPLPPLPPVVSRTPFLAQPQPQPQGGAPAPATYYPPYPVYGPPPAADPNMWALLQQMQANMEAMNARLNQQAAPMPMGPPPTSPLPPVGQTGWTNRVRGNAPAADDLGDDPTAVDQPRRGLVKATPPPKPREGGQINGFETLNLDWLSGPIPSKPTRRVLFQFPTGRNSGWYHDVIIADNCVALVYDTRHEGGQQFLPTVESEMIEIHLPATAGRPEVNMGVVSAGLEWTLGVFDIIVLLRPGPEQAVQ